MAGAKETNVNAHATPTTPNCLANNIANGMKSIASIIVEYICGFKRPTPLEKDENNLFHISTIANRHNATKYEFGIITDSPIQTFITD